MEKDELIVKLSNFIRKEKFQEIKEIIKKFKDEKNYDMVCFSSQAFINMDEYKEALEILDTIKNKYSESGEFCIRYAMALYNSNREDEALEWFKKAKEKGIKEIDETSGRYYPKSVEEWIKRAKLWKPRRIEKNNFEKYLREKRSKEPILNVSFDEDVIKDLWDNDKYFLKEYVGKIPTDEDFKKVEKELGYHLPESYKILMRIQNGGILYKNTFLFASYRLFNSYLECRGYSLSRLTVIGLLVVEWQSTLLPIFSICSPTYKAGNIHSSVPISNTCFLNIIPISSFILFQSLSQAALYSSASTRRLGFL